jgi:large subunit ribosomal protein L25
VREGGVLSQPLRELSVEALPLEVPEHIDLDVAHMELGATLRVADIVVGEGVTLLDEPETVVATVTAPTREVAPEEMLEGEEAAALTEDTAGETPEGGAEAPAEPAADAAGEHNPVEG